MVDPDDNRTLELLGMTSSLQFKRWMFISAYSNARFHRDERMRYRYSVAARHWLQMLGGLASPW